MKKKKKILCKKILIIISLLFILANVLIIVHTYKFTHYNSDILPNKKQSVTFKDILFGIDIGRPINEKQPNRSFEEIVLFYEDKELKGWLIKSDCVDSKGVVFLAHGYNASRSSMLDKADLFLSEGYDTFLLDFMGVGDSDGSQTTIGYKEAENIRLGYLYLSKKQDKEIILFGTSMGAAAIMKAIHDYPSQIKPKAVILECPYSTMLETVKARFRIMNMPQWIAYPFTFWGGTINGFNAFSLRPIDYASAIKAPTLLIYGKHDDRVSIEETQAIFNSLNEPKYLKIYPNSGHDDYLKKDKEVWIEDIRSVLSSL